MAAQKILVTRTKTLISGAIAQLESDINDELATGKYDIDRTTVTPMGTDGGNFFQTIVFVTQIEVV